MSWNEDIMTNDGLIQFCKLKILTNLVLYVLNFFSFSTTMIDINLSPEVFDKLVNLPRFRIKAHNIPIMEEVTTGFRHVIHLRNQNNKN